MVVGAFAGVSEGLTRKERMNERYCDPPMVLHIKASSELRSLLACLACVSYLIANWYYKMRGETMIGMTFSKLLRLFTPALLTLIAAIIICNSHNVDFPSHSSIS